MKYYTTQDVKQKTDRGIQCILKWARTNNVESMGNGNGKTYLWTEEDINKFLEYTQTVKIGKPKKKLPPTDNLDTIYKRLNRAKKNGDVETINQTMEFIKKVRTDKKGK